MKIKEAPKRNFERLEAEITALRSFIIGLAGRDSEGEYRPEFVRRIFRAAQEKAVFEFSDRRSFLNQLKK